MARAVSLDRRPFVRTVRWRTVTKVCSIRFEVRWYFPVLGREIVEGEQRVTILAEAAGDFLLFHPATFNDGVESGHGLGPRLGHRCPGAPVAFRCWVLGSLLRTLPVL